MRLASPARTISRPSRIFPLFLPWDRQGLGSRLFQSGQMQSLWGFQSLSLGLLQMFVSGVA